MLWSSIQDPIPYWSGRNHFSPIRIVFEVPSVIDPNVTLLSPPHERPVIEAAGSEGTTIPQKDEGVFLIVVADRDDGPKYGAA